MELEHVEICRATMLGDLMHVVTECAKALPKPWQQLGEHEQNWWIESIEKQCTNAIEQCVTLLAGEGRTSISATLKRVVFKGSVEALLTIERQADHRIDLADAAGRTVRLVIWETADLIGNDGKPTAQPDQPTLDLQTADDEAEQLYDNDTHLLLAIEFVRKTRKVSISALQRNLGIGYDRAARLLERLELHKVVSPLDASGRRVVLTETGA